MTGARLLAVFAHPDDESLASGGLLARHSDRGEPTSVATATWAGGTARAADLADALGLLGAGQPRLLGYADARVPESAPGRPRWVDVALDEAVRRLVVQVREVRPDIVVTHDAYGGLTGHEDHVQTHRVTMLAVQAAGLEQLYPEAGPAWLPGATYLATHPHSVLPMLREVVGDRRAVHTVPDHQVTTRLDVGPWVEQKIAAILAHHTEVERGGLPRLVAGLSSAARTELLSTEWYTRWTPSAPADGASELSSGV